MNHSLQNFNLMQWNTQGVRLKKDEIIDLIHTRKLELLDAV